MHTKKCLIMENYFFFIDGSELEVGDMVQSFKSLAEAEKFLTSKGKLFYFSSLKVHRILLGSALYCFFKVKTVLAAPSLLVSHHLVHTY